MPRKSIVTVLHERYGGTWVFDNDHKDRWISDDNRICFRLPPKCECWAFRTTPLCTCPNQYKFNDGTMADLTDKSVYHKNGRSTKLPIKKRGRREKSE